VGERVDLVVMGRVCARHMPHQRFIECIYKCILRRVHRMRPPKNNNNSPFAHPYLLRRLLERLLHATCGGNRETRLDRGGDTNIVPSEPLIVIERGTGKESPPGERSGFEEVVVLHSFTGVLGQRVSLWSSQRSTVAASMPFSLFRT